MEDMPRNLAPLAPRLRGYLARMPNRLADETSPYLLQHAKPGGLVSVGTGSVGARRAEDKPILLSVGYAACHWCHVMAHESFEDEATARVMNERFVNIKVDREERPDVDSIYMRAVQAMTGHGGWPMTVFLTPAGRAVLRRDVLPARGRHGMPSFVRVLTAVVGFVREPARPHRRECGVGAARSTSAREPQRRRGSDARDARSAYAADRERVRRARSEASAVRRSFRRR